MEELILKYLDGTADDTEITMVQNLLKTDSEFAALYQEYVTLENDLHTIIAERYNADVHLRMKNKVFVAYKSSKEKELLPLKYLGSIIVAACCIIAIAIWQFGAETGLLTDYLPQNSDWFSITAWLTVSFLILLIFDQLFRKIVVQHHQYQLK